MEELFNAKNVGLLLVAVGGVSGIIGLVKEVPNMLIKLIRQNLIYSITVYKHFPLFEEFNEWFYLNYTNKFKNVEVDGNDLIGGGNTTNLTQKTGTFYIKYNGTLFWIIKDKIELKSTSSNKPFIDTYQICSFSKSSIDELYKFLSRKRECKDQIKIFTNSQYGDWRLHQKIEPKKMDSVVIPSSKKESILNDMREFISQMNWYDSLGIPYNRGYLYYGKAGNGKTSLAIAQASEFQMNIFSLDISSLNSDADLKETFRNIEKNSILLIEDIDKAFKERNSDNKGITFSCFLNCLNGVYAKKGVITIMTTNHIEHLDPALIRSGRVDVKIEIENPSAEEISKYLCIFYQKEIILNSYNGDMCMADIQNICLQNKTDHEEAIKMICESKILKIA